MTSRLTLPVSNITASQIFTEITHSIDEKEKNIESLSLIKSLYTGLTDD
jgi:hypothetical protein